MPLATYDPVRSASLFTLTLASALASAIGASHAGAQTSFALTPRAGVIIPVGALGDAPSLQQIQGAPPESSRAELLGGVVLGFSLGMDRASLPVVLRTDVDIVPSVPVTLDGRRSAYDVALAMVTAGLMTRPYGDGWFRPYAHAGLGFRSFRTGVSISHGPQLPDQRVDPQARLGGGAEFVAGKLAVRTELESQLASFRFDEVQDHNPDRRLYSLIALTVGVRFEIE